MAGVKSEAQLETDGTAVNRGDGFVSSLADWIKMDDEAASRANEAHYNILEAGKGTKAVIATVTGRPTTAGAVSIKTTQSTQVDLGGKNWIGLLHEYRQAHDSVTGLDYIESSLGLNQFVCTIIIGESPTPLGNTNAVFARKKDAKQYASKLAVEWLIANNHMPAIGGVTLRKPPPVPQHKAINPSASHSVTSPATQPGSTGAVSPSGTSFGQQVAEMCTRLGMNLPTYVIKPDAAFPALYSGYASFGDNPLVQDRVAEFENIHGRKKAKEACAEDLLRFLENIMKQRMGAAGNGVGTGSVDIGWAGRGSGRDNS